MVRENDEWKNGVYLSLGSNLGNRGENLQNARIQIEKRIGPILKASSIYESAPWGKEDLNYFYNQVIEINTKLPPSQLLHEVLSIEADLGRKRVEGVGEYENRLIDIDILYYGDLEINSLELIIPHPHIKSRLFVLVPLKEISPNMKPFAENYSMQELIQKLTSEQELVKLKNT